jgi:predicted O-linked N-acetylglucosamine transferase (SPINDLY family)
MKNWIRKLLSADAALQPVGASTGVSPSVPTADPAMTSEALRARGNDLLDAGNLTGAKRCYRQAIALDPGSVSSHVNLGYVLKEQRHLDDAERQLKRALVLDPTVFDAQYMLGGIARERGHSDAAIGHYNEVIARNPRFELAYRDLCQTLFDCGQKERAREVVLNGLAVSPQFADLHYFLGNLQLHDGQNAQAIESYSAALAIHPDYAEVQANMGLALRSFGQPEASAHSYRQALASRPDSAEWRFNLGLALHELGRLDEAVAEYRKALSINGQHFEAHANLGVTLHALGDFEASVRSHKNALAVQPESVFVYCNLGLAYQSLNNLAAAIGCYERAVEIDPESAHAHAAMAVAFNDRGLTDAALASFQRALSLDPNLIEARSNQLFVLSHASPARYLEEARKYGDRVSALAKPYTSWPGANAFSGTTTMLRVGVVSGDLREHPVGRFLEGVITHLDPARVELFAYTTNQQQDQLTARLKRRFSGWASIVGMTDGVAAGRIHADGLHILIDLAGHTAHNRLPVFAWRPAPVQVSWLGYFASTGVPAIDHLLADEVSVPPANREHFTEHIWYLPDTRLCFTAPAAGNPLKPTAPPALRNGHVTFACFQNLSKVNDAVLAAWAQILSALPECRLRVQSKQTGTVEAREGLLRRLASVGIAPERVTIALPAARDLYLAAHAEVDIILDTFPFPGGTTTCEALWMGVPTITLAGDSLLSRQGASLLSCAGLPDWIATDEADYVARAVARASDTDSLAGLRRCLREQVLASPLFDGALFARRLETALSEMWRRYLDQGRAEP